MTIRGIFHAGRPHVSGLLVFPGLCGLDDVPVNFVVDSGADRSLIAPSEYVDYFSYADATRYPLSDSSGFGGGIVAHLVPARLGLRSTTGRYTFTSLIIDVPRPDQRLRHLPSVLGRDVLDRFRLTIDRTEGLVGLAEPHDPASIGAWADEDAVDRQLRKLDERRLKFDGMSLAETLEALRNPGTYPVLR